MAKIQNRFLAFKTEAAFKTQLEANNILDTSIVFVLDAQYIYSHGTYFYCDFAETDIRDLVKSTADAINKTIGTVPAGKTVVGMIEEAVSTGNLVLYEGDAESANKTVSADGKTYTLKQGGVEVASFNIARDMVISDGSVITATGTELNGTGTSATSAGLTKGEKYIRLTISNADEKANLIYIPVNSLYKDHTTEQKAAKIQLNISEDNVISANVVKGSIEKTDLTSAVQTEITNATNNIATIQGTGDGSIKKALQDAKSYTDTEAAKKVDKTTTVNGHALSGNVTVTKSDVGLGNADNTSDLDKPISTATQTALDKKENITNVRWQKGTGANSVVTKDTGSTAGGNKSISAGSGTSTTNEGEAAFGIFNKSNTGETDAAKTIFSVGNGTSASDKSNALEIKKDGSIVYKDINDKDAILQTVLDNEITWYEE